MKAPTGVRCSSVWLDIRHEYFHPLIEYSKTMTGKESLRIPIEAPNGKFNATNLSDFRFCKKRPHQLRANTASLERRKNCNMLQTKVMESRLDCALLFSDFFCVKIAHRFL